ncbi:MAG: hypothetical protein OXC48_04140 [Endozoicomonadaceae bacterium]|nr:hypothetical protein [Endozoicomonadaceae bacterium]
MTGPVYGYESTVGYKQDKWTFVTEQILADKKLGRLVTTPMETLRVLQEADPNMLVESLHEFSFKASHQHLGESDNIRKTYFSSIPGLKEVISAYSLSKYPLETAGKNLLRITLSGVIKHLENKEKSRDLQFAVLLKTLNTPFDTGQWYIHDGGTTDEAINNVAMEFYQSFRRFGQSIRKLLWNTKDKNPSININPETYFKELYAMDEQLDDSAPNHYIVMIARDSSAPDESVNTENDKPDHTGKDSRSYLPSGQTIKLLFNALLFSQAVNSVASMSIPPYLKSEPITDTANGCLAPDGQCILVGNTNISKLMTQNHTQHFVAAEDIDANQIPWYSNTTSVVPGVFSGTFATGLHSLKGFPINNTVPLFESLNNSQIRFNAPVKKGSVPNNAQPVLAQRTLNANHIEATLQWPLKTQQSGYQADDYYTHPMTGNIAGNNNKFVAKHNIPYGIILPFPIILNQRDTGVIATEVSGSHNHLEHTGEVELIKTANNVPGNIAKIISGVNNKLSIKGPLIRYYTRSGEILLSPDCDACTECGILRLYAPARGTNGSQWEFICSKGFSHTDSVVACRQLDFTSGKHSHVFNSTGRSPLINNTICNDNETNKKQCFYNSVKDYNYTEPVVEIYCTREKNYNTNTALYSGVLEYAPRFTTNAPFAFWDRAGFADFTIFSEDFNRFPRENSVDTTKPADWRKAHQFLCASEQCNISCHYVNEQSHSVVNSDNKTFLVSRQRYPSVKLLLPTTDFTGREARGLIRVTDISDPGAAGTIQLYQPPLNDSQQVTLNIEDDSVIYTVPVSERITNNTLLSLHKRPRYLDVSNLGFSDFNGGESVIQLSELSLDVNNGTYQSTTYDFPGEEALLLNDDSVFTHNKLDRTIKKYSLDYNEERYSIGEINVTYQLPNEQFITAGTDGNSLYIVTKKSDYLSFSRYDMQTGQKYSKWSRLEKPNNFFDENGNYELSFVGDEIQLIRRGEIFSRNGVPHTLHIPQLGGCSEIQPVKFVPAPSVTPEIPVPSATSETPVPSATPEMSVPSVISETPAPSVTPDTPAENTTLLPTSSQSKSHKNHNGAIFGVLASIPSIVGVGIAIVTVCIKNKKHNNNVYRLNLMDTPEEDTENISIDDNDDEEILL